MAKFQDSQGTPPPKLESAHSPGYEAETKKISLRLSVPPISGSGIHLQAKSPRELAQDVMSLPFEDIPCALTLTRKKLEVLNRLDIDGARRSLVTQPYNVAYGKILQYYVSFFSESRFSREIEDNELDELSRLTQEMAFAYKHMLKSYLVLPDNHREKAQCTYMAMYYLGQILMQFYDRHLSVSGQIWQEIHSLYAYAERKTYLNTQVYDPIQPELSHTIHQLYLQICLTAAADPYRLKPGENWVVYNYVRQWAQFAEILPPISHLSNNHCFCVNLASNERPFPIGSKEIMGNATVRWISMSKFQPLLLEQINQMDAGYPPEPLGMGQWIDPTQAAKLLRKLQQAWQNSTHRREKRSPHVEKVSLIWGFADIYRYLSPDHRRQAMLQNQKIVLQHNAMAMTDNVSLNGVGLRIPAKANLNQLSAGQVVLLLRKTQQNNQIIVGTVCWSAKNSSSETTIGIRRLHGTPRPILVKSPHDVLDERPAILIFSDRNSQKKIESLLAPNGMVNPGEHLILSNGSHSEEFEVEVSELLDTTNIADRFRFKPVYH